MSVDKTGAQAAQDARKNAAEALSKSLAGKRGTSAIRRVYAKGEKPPAEEESLIFLFYKDFKINRTMGGLVMCDVRFIVLHTLENKINNLRFPSEMAGNGDNPELQRGHAEYGNVF